MGEKVLELWLSSDYRVNYAVAYRDILILMYLLQHFSNLKKERVLTMKKVAVFSFPVSSNSELQEF
ncbi:MAG: hypothetical protein AYK19_13160 [Theionarchaea archaeon DG-70-1]|nr:MAG: hypothetical protein AYK19_13160 [Theionarchaea archaeon DG-70-1]